MLLVMLIGSDRLRSAPIGYADSCPCAMKHSRRSASEVGQSMGGRVRGPGRSCVTQGVKRCLEIKWSVLLVPRGLHRCTLTATLTQAGLLMLLLGTARSR